MANVEKQETGWAYQLEGCWTPLGFPTRTAAREALAAAVPNRVRAKKNGTLKKLVDTTPEGAVTSSQVDETPTHTGAQAPQNTPQGDNGPQGHNDAPQGQEHNMSMVTLIKDNKERKGVGKSAVYHIEGVRGSVKVSSTIFEGDAPATLEVEIPNLAQPNVPNVPKAKETAEERKARLASLPKLTPAERLAKLEAKVARAKAKLAAPSL